MDEPNCRRALLGYIDYLAYAGKPPETSDSTMTPIARALTNELLAHHRYACLPGRGIDQCLITYGNLCKRAGHSEALRSVGRFLLETAEWCAVNNYPPLNSLAVNAESRMPGDSYNIAPGCDLLSWPDEVRACIDFTAYPDTVDQSHDVDSQSQATTYSAAISGNPRNVDSVDAPANSLFGGDNLAVLRNRVKDGSVGLVFADPTFPAETLGFTERHSYSTKPLIDDLANNDEFASLAPRLQSLLREMSHVLENLSVTLALTSLAIRAVEFRRVLNNVGSLYLHCDQPSCPYVRLLLDVIFGPDNYRGTIIWKWRPLANAGAPSYSWPQSFSPILHYSKSRTASLNPIYRPLAEEKARKLYSHIEEGTGRRFRLQSLVNPNQDRPNLKYEFLGITRVWRYPRERMERLLGENLIFRLSPTAEPRRKVYLDEDIGERIGDVWDDIAAVQSSTGEWLRYETQKPQRLVERIIEAATNKGDLVLDPYCGSGTTLVAAERLQRKWIGIDSSPVAVALSRYRLLSQYGMAFRSRFTTTPEPHSVEEAAALANESLQRFEWWAIGLVGARPLSTHEPNTADGRLYFYDDDTKRSPQEVVVEVKRRASQESVLRLMQQLEDWHAAIGVLITLDEPTSAVQKVAQDAGYYHTPAGSRYRKVQILTIEALLKGRMPDVPPPLTMMASGHERPA